MSKREWVAAFLLFLVFAALIAAMFGIIPPAGM